MRRSLAFILLLLAAPAFGYAPPPKVIVPIPALPSYDRVTSYSDADGNLIRYRSDQSGNVTSLVYPGGKNVFYAYDRLNRLTNVTDWANRRTGFEYDLASRVKVIRRPNGTVRTMDYDAAGEATNLWETTAGGVPIAVFKLGWSTAARVEWEFAAPPPHPSTPPPRTMTFDDDNRLATFNGQSVTHDLDGNMTNGPLTNDTFASYTYDTRNRLITVGQSVPPVSLSYGYDAVGNRTALTNGATVTKYVINPNAALSQVLMRIKGGVTNYYVYGLGLLYEITETAGSTNTLTYHHDYRGSTIALTDGTGNVTDRMEYSAYGSLTYRFGATDTPFLYNGRYGVQTDPNGLLHMRARYYNPHLCRFLNPDPSGFSGGLNWYAYADGNPVIMIDPFGLGADTLSGSGSWLDRTYSGIGNALLGPVDYGDGSISFNQADFGRGAEGYFSSLEQEATRREVGRHVVTSTAALIPYERVVGALLGQGGRVAAAAERTLAVSPYRMTTAGETFSHYGYAENAVSFQGGLRPGGFATSVGDLSGAGAQSGLALPRAVPPNAVYTVTTEAGTWTRANPVTRPQFGQPGGLPEYQFPGGTGPGTVSPPRPIP